MRAPLRLCSAPASGPERRRCAASPSASRTSAKLDTRAGTMSATSAPYLGCSANTCGRMYALTAVLGALHAQCMPAGMAIVNPACMHACAGSMCMLTQQQGDPFAPPTSCGAAGRGCWGRTGRPGPAAWAHPAASRRTAARRAPALVAFPPRPRPP